ncbi:MAG: hypothetical protein J6C44_10750 [Muribaculaceae bacterium]|nr:hypothetical protein [Muribaculaceae bacterium]
MNLLSANKTRVIIEVGNKAYFLDKNNNYTEYSFGDKDDIDYVEPTDFTTTQTPTTGELGYGGKTVFPVKGELYNSVNENLYVFINSAFSEEGQAQMIAHEAYGHAYLFLKYGGNLKISRHNYQHKNGYNFYGNRILNKRIIDGMNEVHYNMSH